MSDIYAKRPGVTRFTRKPTYVGRDVKRAVVSRRTHPGLIGRRPRPLKPMK